MIPAANEIPTACEHHSTRAAHIQDNESRPAAIYVNSCTHNGSSIKIKTQENDQIKMLSSPQSLI
jgi:hypothetical protein